MNEPFTDSLWWVAQTKREYNKGSTLKSFLSTFFMFWEVLFLVQAQTFLYHHFYLVLIKRPLSKCTGDSLLPFTASALGHVLRAVPKNHIGGPVSSLLGSNQYSNISFSPFYACSWFIRFDLYLYTPSFVLHGDIPLGTN